MFLDRCISFGNQGSACALVLPQNWLLLSSYERLRRRLLHEIAIRFVSPLGEEGFQSFGVRGPRVALWCSEKRLPRPDEQFFALDASTSPGKLQILIPEKIEILKTAPLARELQARQLENPDARIIIGWSGTKELLERYAASLQGISPADLSRYGRRFWEVSLPQPCWRFWQSSPDETKHYGGRERVLWWNDDFKTAVAEGRAYVRGQQGWGRQAVAVSLMRALPATISTGEAIDTNVAVIVPNDHQHVPAIWSFCESPEFQSLVRQIDQKLNVTNGTLVKVPFDLERWEKLALERYPEGLPQPASTDPTQWLFSGYPAEATWPLQVAVARLVGYRWPRQTGAEFHGSSIRGPDGLDVLAEEDGIVCVPSVRGERPGAERLRSLLARSFGATWSPAKEADLLAEVGYTGKSLEQWLRDGFFEQHCQLFPAAAVRLADLGRTEGWVLGACQLSPSRPREPGEADLHVSRRLDSVAA